MSEIKTARLLRARRYRNRRLGDFLKELGLTEGRATGIPTIQRALAANGSPRAIISTDEDRSFFLIDIPCHIGFEGENVFGSQDEQKDEQKELTERQKAIINELSKDVSATLPELSLKTSIKYATLRREMNFLQKEGFIARDGGRKEGRWIILKS